MKKLLVLILTLALACSLLAGCEYINPENYDNPLAGAFDSVKGFFGGLFGKDEEPNENNGGNENEEPQVHEHDFVLVKTSKATCSRDGKEMYECSCGEKKEVKTDDAFGHTMKKSRETKVTCEQAGSIVYKCSVCGFKEEERFAPLGHEYGESSEASRLIPCTREGCTYGKLAESNGKYKEVLVFTFDEEDEAEIEAKYNEILTLLENAEAYDAALHGYSETGALADAYLVIDEMHTELYDLVLNAVTQRQLAEILYYGNMGSAELKETYSYMMEYYTSLISQFYSLSQPFYDSMYREFFYYGMTEQEILEYLAESNAVSDGEYAELTARNSEIEIEYLSIGAPETDPQVLELYYEFVQNNKRIAEIMGYEGNYLAYAYENVYDRDYSYEDVAEFREYVKRYIAPIYCDIYSTYVEMMSDISFVSKASDDYNVQFEFSFFKNVTSNSLLNDYIDLLAFDTEKMSTTFSDEFNNLMGDGNLFRGTYRGAFVTRLSALDLPVAYFGSGYDNTFTVAHEFGHFMNEIYNPDAGSQSFDLLEMHSQGNEVLYLSFLEDNLSAEGYSLVKIYQLLNMLYTSVTALTVDTFEQAVYLDEYTGHHASTIMADGTITMDEYDLLYESILIDFGIQQWNSVEYWRYVTITSPCYYVSYSVSAISVLQIYQMAEEESFDVARDAYLKLFTYTDDDPTLTTEEALLYAGLRSFKDPFMFLDLSEFLSEDIKYK